MYWMITVLGILLFSAPFVLGFATNPAALWTCFSLGLVVALSASTKAVTEDEGKWEGVVSGTAGVLTVIAPFVLGFSGNAAALWTCVILGFGVALAAGYKALANDQAERQILMAGLGGILAVLTPFIMGVVLAFLACWHYFGTFETP